MHVRILFPAHRSRTSLLEPNQPAAGSQQGMAPDCLAIGLRRGHARAHSGLVHTRAVVQGKDARNNTGGVKAHVQVHFNQLLPSDVGLLGVHNSFQHQAYWTGRETAGWTLTEYHIQSSIQLSPPLSLGRRSLVCATCTSTRRHVVSTGSIFINLYICYIAT